MRDDPAPRRGIDPAPRAIEHPGHSNAPSRDAMKPLNPDAQSLLVAEIEERRRALLRLRAQMLQMHARLEYLRLMIRLSRRDSQL
jgi:hypothetical protein